MAMDRLSSNASPWPASILLATEAYEAASRNDTTATARLWGNHTVEVTFWIADPPAASFYTFHCNCIKSPGTVSTQVAGAEGRFVFLHADIDDDSNYFMYKGDPKSPSLESVPLPDDDGYYSLREDGVEFAIVPRGDDGHYLLIALSCLYNTNNYRLHIYSSENATWTTKELLNPCPGAHTTITPNKVFVIRDGLLLWVDLLKGMLLCDILQEPYHAQYIPLPEPLVGNREPVKQFHPGVWRFRDLTCVDGLIKFIEMEHRQILRKITVKDGVPPLEPIDPRTKDVLYDSDLIKLTTHKPVEPEICTKVLENGWSTMTWTRNIGSNCWHKGRVVDVDDLLVDDSFFAELLSGQKSEPESAGSLTFKNMYSAWPALSADGNDILYLKSYNAGAGALVGVDLAEKTVKVAVPGAHPFGIYFYVSKWNILRPCALANHLKKTPGILVSACQIARTSSSANKQTEKAGHPAATASSPHEPSNAAIRVDEPDSYESDNKRPRLQSF